MSHQHHHHTADDPQIRVEAIERLLTERGLIDAQRVERLIERYETDVGPMNGARVVARAWCDDAYRERLLDDGTDAVREFDFPGAQMDRLVVKENTDTVHNVVCCTLCSCYPWAVLGLPPAWYKSSAYRARIVREPRRVLAEFGTEVPEGVELRVWDSSAEVRYLVLPQKPAEAEGIGEGELARWITRDAMIGVVRKVTPPASTSETAP